MVHVKPFGAFLEFQAELPSFMAAAAEGGSERAVLVGLMHRSEVSWDPQVSITDVLQVRCGTGRVVRAGWGKAVIDPPRGCSPVEFSLQGITNFALPFHETPAGWAAGEGQAAACRCR